MLLIKNVDTLAQSGLRADALAIAEAGYAAINVATIVEEKLSLKNETLLIAGNSFPLAGRRIFFVAVGKCSFVVAQAIEELLGDRLTAGIALDVSSVDEAPLKTVMAYQGTHPLPSETNVAATREIFALLKDLAPEDLVIFCISGGGSTLLCQPVAPMTSADEGALFRALTAQGASIQELNTVRKHTSRARGGGLAAAAYPAEVLSLIISDVPGNDMACISSAPTLLDSSTVADAEATLTRYGVAVTPPLTLIETEKEQKYFSCVTNILFLTNQDALAAMREAAAMRGYAVEIISDRYAGEARDVGRAVVERLHAAAAKTVHLYAGESTVTVGSAGGAGGRNQEMTLAALEMLQEDELLLPFASDGHDNTDHAGALGDALTRAHANANQLSIPEYLEAHRSYDFFTATGDALVTGYTGSNVSDLIIAIKK